MRIILFYIIIIIITLSGCKSTPDNVINHNKMAHLLADIHKGECVIELNRTEYQNDSLKKVLKQSIYLKHGVTAEQVDTSFIWYGENIEEFVKVYDQVLDILNEDLATINSITNNNKLITATGDSIDAWNRARNFTISTFSPNNYLTFVIDRDINWEKGDRYIWKMKLINALNPVDCIIYAEYPNGKTESHSIQFNNNGWNDIKLITDSTKIPNRIYGFAKITTPTNSYTFIDSVSLIRMRLKPIEYRQRYNYKSYFDKN